MESKDFVLKIKYTFKKKYTCRIIDYTIVGYESHQDLFQIVQNDSKRRLLSDINNVKSEEIILNLVTIVN